MLYDVTLTVRYRVVATASEQAKAIVLEPALEALGYELGYGWDVPSDPDVHRRLPAVDAIEVERVATVADAMAATAPSSAAAAGADPAREGG